MADGTFTHLEATFCHWVSPVRRGSSFGLPDSVVELSSFGKIGGQTMDEKVLEVVVMDSVTEWLLLVLG